MPTYDDVIRWVEEHRKFRISHTCWIAHCKAIATGVPHPELNRNDEPRIVPCPKGEIRDAIMECFDTMGVPDGKRLYPSPAGTGKNR